MREKTTIKKKFLTVEKASKQIDKSGCDEKSLREKTLPSNAPEIFGEV